MQSVPITSYVAITNPAQDDVYSIQHFVRQFVSDLLQISRDTPATSPYKTDRNIITENVG